MNKMSLLTTESREAFGVRRIPALLTDSRLVMRSSESAGMRRTPNASRLARTYRFWMMFLIFAIGTASGAVQEIEVTKFNEPGNTKPIWVSMSGFTGEAAGHIGPELGPQITADFPEVVAALAGRAGG